ncbi:MAG: translation initiation factor IF-2 subunit beta [Methanomassiliicoccaceae archaeon]|nr:translation initiation factor IF-2 subunit beta [Methanomassiliicoccaceae archaeon]
MKDEDYLSLLDRAKNCLPETIENHERFSLPEIDVLQEGKITVVRNFIDITDKLRRDPQHVLQYLLRELGTPGDVDGRRAVLKAKLGVSQISTRIQEYTDTFVICSECGLPDTHMSKEGRTLVLECEACGARRPVNAKKSSKSDTPSELRAGDVVEILIHDVGKKGDGVGKLQNYLVVVPGTVKGTRVKVKITNISGTTAFGAVTQDAPTR